MAEPGTRREPAGDVAPRILLEVGSHGGFAPAVQEQLERDHALARRIAGELLADNFPFSLHDEVLAAIGMPGETATRAAGRRDPAFRALILRIYERRCAVCGYDGRLGSADLAIDAAHVRWQAAGGPDSEDNGVALCALHREVFDRGGISLDDDLRVRVSERVAGSTVIPELILGFDGRPLRRPLPGHAPPARPHVRWHWREVFRGPARTG